MKSSDQSLPIFKVGDLVTPKANYTNEGWSNVDMCNAGVGMRFGAVYTIKSIKGDMMFFKEIHHCDFSLNRFVLAKPKIVREIIKDLL